MEVQEQLRDTHAALLAALDATHALLLVLAVTPDTPTRYTVCYMAATFVVRSHCTIFS